MGAPSAEPPSRSELNLFLSQHHRRVHVRSFSRGNPSSASSHGKEDQRNCREHATIPWIDAIGKDVRQRPNRRDGKRQAGHNPAGENRHTIADRRPDNHETSGADRRADCHLASAAAREDPERAMASLTDAEIHLNHHVRIELRDSLRRIRAAMDLLDAELPDGDNDGQRPIVGSGDIPEH